MKKYRCTGLWWAFFCLLFPFVSSGQSAVFQARADSIAAGDAWKDTGDFDRAHLAYVKALGVETDSLGALAQHKIGVAYYNNYQDSLAAIAYQKAIRMRDEVFSGPVAERAHSRLNLAQIVQAEGLADSASVLLREAIDIFARAEPTDSLNWMRALTSLVSLAEDARDYQVAVNAARQSVAILEASSGFDAYDAFNTRYAAGSAYYIFGDLAAAERSASAALRLAEEIGEPLEKLQSYNLLGSIANEKGELQQSIRYQLLGLKIAEDNGLDGYQLGLLHFNLARRYGKAGNADRALFHQHAALPLLSDKPLYLSRLYTVAGEIYLEDKKYTEALAEFDRGASLLLEHSGAFGNGSWKPAELEIYANLLNVRAETLTKLERRAAARREYTLLFTVQDDLRSRVTSDESRRYLSGNLRPLFDRAIDLEYAEYQEAPSPETAWRAFSLSERAKAYSLLTARQRDRNTMPARESALRARIAALERTVAPEDNQLAAARLELDRVLHRRTGRDSVAIPTLDREEFTDLLRRESTVLLAYHVGEGTTYRFHIDTTGNIGFQTLPAAEELPERVNAWRKALRESAYRNKSLRSGAEQTELDRLFLEQGVGLYQQLFAGLELREGSRLCILPDGPLSVLPFAALPLTTEAELPLNYQTLAYLHGRYTVHYAYSARSWRGNVRAAPLDYELNVLAFAPAFNGKKGTVNSNRGIRLRDGDRALTALSSLAFNRAEVDEITRMTPWSEAFVAEEANRSNFIDNLGRARILHLSTHGLVNAAHPELSFVAFTQRGDSLEYDEMLYYNDLSSLPVQTEMAVLSACETALGTYAPGETTLSLASAFTAAGARSTLTTLWQVDDAATKGLMVDFYRRIGEGDSRGHALGEAMRMHQQSAEYAHPFYWSAMTLYGNAGPIALRGEPWLRSRAPYLLLVIPFLLAGWLWFRRSK